VAICALARPFVAPAVPLEAAIARGVAAAAWAGGATIAMAAGIAAPPLTLAAAYLAGTPPTSMSLVGAALFVILLLFVARAIPPARAALSRDREWSQIDPLTNLGNRRQFQEIVALEVNRTRRYDRPLALAYIDCDGFEIINQRRGYAAGDEVLQRLASALRSSLRTSDTVARIAGDEFALLLPETHAEGAVIVVAKVRELLDEAADDVADSIGFSIVVLTYTSGPLAVTEFLRQADTAMVDLKKRDRGTTRHVDYVHPEVTAL
jgi:diguanylate cyclase (GGDEF)-like protein